MKYKSNTKSVVKGQRQSASISKTKAVKAMKKAAGPKASFKYADVENSYEIKKPRVRRKSK